MPVTFVVFKEHPIATPTTSEEIGAYLSMVPCIRNEPMEGRCVSGDIEVDNYYARLFSYEDSAIHSDDLYLIFMVENYENQLHLPDGALITNELISWKDRCNAPIVDIHQYTTGMTAVMAGGANYIQEQMKTYRQQTLKLV
ncbi:hypothetical protein D3C71_545640 [compost metagenome]